MVHVLVLGAGGYIGNGVALSLRRAGHKVWGVVRKSDQAEQLKLNEIIPIVGDLSDVKSYESAFDSVSHIIDASSSAADIQKLVHDSIHAYAEKSPRKITFIFTSGLLVYGKQADGVIADEDVTVPNIAPMFVGRAATEEKIIKNQKLNGVVVRPGWVFGGSGGHYLDHFWSFDGSNGDFEFKGTVDKIWSWIHVLDLAALYVKIVEAPSSVIAHQTFNAADDSRVKLIDIRSAMAKAAGAKGKPILVPAGTDPFSQACEITILISNNKAKRLLNWAPKFQLLDDTPTYYQSWKAHHK